MSDNESVYHCHICLRNCDSFEDFEEHLNRQRHVKALKRYMEGAGL